MGDANAALAVLRQASELDPSNKSVREEVTNGERLLKLFDEIEKAVTRADYRMVSGIRHSFRDISLIFCFIFQAIFYLDQALNQASGCRNLKITKAEYLVYLQKYGDAQEIVK